MSLRSAARSSAPPSLHRRDDGDEASGQHGGRMAIRGARQTAILPDSAAAADLGGTRAARMRSRSSHPTGIAAGQRGGQRRRPRREPLHAPHAPPAPSTRPCSNATTVEPPAAQREELAGLRAGNPGSTAGRTPRCRARRSRRAARRRRPAPRAVHRTAAGAGSWRRRSRRSVRRSERPAAGFEIDRERAHAGDPGQRRERRGVAVDRQHACPRPAKKRAWRPRPQARSSTGAPGASSAAKRRIQGEGGRLAAGDVGSTGMRSGGGRVGRWQKPASIATGRSRRPAPAPHGAHPDRKTDTGAARRYPRVQSRAA